MNFWVKPILFTVYYPPKKTTWPVPGLWIEFRQFSWLHVRQEINKIGKALWNLWKIKTKIKIKIQIQVIDFDDMYTSEKRDTECEAIKSEHHGILFIIWP